MSTTSIECPECARKMDVEEATLGQRVTCPKCKETFVAEKPGLYDFVEEPTAASSTPPPPPPPSPRLKAGAAPDRPARSPRGGPSEALSDEKKGELLSSMEKWAEE